LRPLPLAPPQTGTQENTNNHYLSLRHSTAAPAAQRPPEAPPADTSPAAAPKNKRSPPPPYGEESPSSVSSGRGGRYPTAYSPARSDHSLPESQGSHSAFRSSPLNPSNEVRKICSLVKHVLYLLHSFLAWYPPSARSHRQYWPRFASPRVLE
jgi:hypothetical protein